MKYFPTNLRGRGTAIAFAGFPLLVEDQGTASAPGTGFCYRRPA